VTVRTRVAPSPTGDPHVGTAYIALFNYCFAKQAGGEFILRIEDTDQTRSTAASERAILESLRWVGLTWDEGPDVGGPRGPYRQSERTDLYREHAQILLDKGAAFKCFCTAERLDGLRVAQMKSGDGYRGYDGKCMELSPTEVAAREDAGEPYVVRMAVPREGVCVINDRLRDPVEIEWSQVDMQVLLKSDGFPTYHLANVVDDHHMGITHVIRGEEWINSAPKHLKLYEAFGWDPPQLVHMPLLRNEDGSKLSKRKNPTSILYYRRVGVLPEALLNYLGMMAWSMPGGVEKFTLEEMVENFNIDRVSLGGPVFDIAKLKDLSGKYIREDLDADALAERLQAWAFNKEYLRSIVPMIHKRLDVLADFGPLTGLFFSGDLEVSKELLLDTKLDPDQTLKALIFGSYALENVRDWQSDTISEALRGVAAAMGLKPKVYLAPFFIAMSGKKVTTPLFDSMAILGSDLTRVRLQAAIRTLSGGKGLGKKKQKKVRKAFDALMAAAASDAE